MIRTKNNKTTEQWNLRLKSSQTFTVQNGWCKFHFGTESRGQDLNYGTSHKHIMAKQSWYTNKVGKNVSAHLTATAPIQSVAAGGKNSQHLQVLVAGCGLMPAQWLLTPDVYAEIDADGAEETPSLDCSTCSVFHITFWIYAESQLSEYIHFIGEKKKKTKSPEQWIGWKKVLI